MKTLTKDNFKEFIADEVIVTFATKSGCRACAEFKPVYQQFIKETPSVKCGIYEREKLNQEPDEIEKKYNINSFPTVLHFKNGEVLGKLETYMFLGEQALAGQILDQEIEYAKRKKALFDMQIRIDAMRAHLIGKPPLPVDAKVDENQTVAPQTKQPIDLSGFPEGQSPEGGGCEGCGESNQ